MRKYIVLIAAVFIQLSLGAGYSWSTFVPILKQNFGLTTTQTQTIFGMGSLVSTILIFLGGRIQDRFGPRIPAFIGGIIFGGSWILAGYSNGSYPALLLFIGILDPVGVGLCYLCPITCSVKWFPKHQSLVTGIAVAGFGGSAIIISQLGEYLLAQQMNVLIIFRYMGLGFIIILAIATIFLQNPPQEIKENRGDIDIKTFDLFKDRKFLGLLCGIFPCLCVGLMIIGNIKPYGLSLNLDMAMAGAAVTILALFNTLGRIIWGFIGGILKGKKTIIISLISTAIV
jgi:OFA family oxalate/formate antiporter-like MFS transporter